MVRATFVSPRLLRYCFWTLTVLVFLSFNKFLKNDTRPINRKSFVPQVEHKEPQNHIVTSSKDNDRSRKLLNTYTSTFQSTRDYTKTPIVIADVQDKSFESCAIGCRFRSSSPYIDASLLDSAPSYPHVILSMEPVSYYPRLDMALKQNNTVLMTVHFDSDVPVPYASWAEYDIFKSPLPFEKREKAAAVFISNCDARNFRLDAVKALQEAGIRVDSFGRCLNNANTVKRKDDVLGSYLFSLSFENSCEEDYVTEKFVQSLVAGSIPVVIGAPNIKRFAPTEDSFLHFKTMEDVKQVAKQMKKIATDKSLYDKMVRWKFEEPDLGYLALMDLSVVHSSCRLCLLLGTQIEERAMSPRLSSDLCSSSEDGQTTYLIRVRERGKFDFIPMTLSELTTYELVSVITNYFESTNYQPIWVGHRKDFRQDSKKLRIWRIYPAKWNAKEVLFGKDAIEPMSGKNSDIFLENFIRTHPCAAFEVIFV